MLVLVLLLWLLLLLLLLLFVLLFHLLSPIPYVVALRACRAVWDVNTLQKIKRFRAHTAVVNSVTAARRGVPLVLFIHDYYTVAAFFC
jgi:hypothetical protein